MKINPSVGLLWGTGLLIFLSGCSSKRTPYQALEKNEGYEDATKDSLRIASFRANARTKKETAVLFAKFRAIEVCLGQGKKVAHILDVRDNSQVKDVIRTSSTGWPSYYYGMSPYYGRFSSGFGVGFSTMSSNAWEETYVYPRYDVTYRCEDKVYGPELVLREISRDEMKLLVKDLKGGLQIDRILEGSPNNKFSEGDVLTKVDGRRVESSVELLGAFSEARNVLRVDLLREGEKRSETMRAVEVTAEVEKAQQQIIQAACEEEELRKIHHLCK